jgi:hypothetical protein
MESGEHAHLSQLSTEDYLSQFGLGRDAISEVLVGETLEILPIESNTEKYLENFAAPGLNKEARRRQTQIYDLTKEEGRKAADMEQRLSFREIVVISQLVPIFLIPIWLAIILSLPIFGVKPYSEDMQKGFLAALATNAFGVCLIIARDLFPLGSEEDKKIKKTKEEWGL